MNKIIWIIFLTVLLFGLTASANADLYDNGDRTITQTRNDGSILMWLQDTTTAKTSGYCDTPGNCSNSGYGHMTWYQAQDWINTLNISNYLGYNNWRLPETLPVNGSSYNYNWSDDGSTDKGYNITSPNSEMSYLFHVDLGNKSYCDTFGNCPQPGNGLINKGPFTNLTPGYYLSNLTPNNDVWFFDFGDGHQDYMNNNYFTDIWAVRSAGVVPEPVSSILFITGGTLLAGRRYIKRMIKA